MKKEVFYYSAPWCTPCKTFGPLFDRVVADMDVEVHKIDVDVDMKQAALHHVWSVPMLVLEEGKQKTNRLIGAVSEKQLRAFLEG